MEAYLIVDGYNIIGAWPELAALQTDRLDYARDKLIAILSEHAALSGQKTVVVFDAYQVKGGNGFSEMVGGIQVIYTKEGVTADMAIERLTAQITKNRNVFVATSDRLQQETIWGKGAFRISAMELKREIDATKKDHKRHYQRKPYSPNRLEDRLTPEIRERLAKIQQNGEENDKG